MFKIGSNDEAISAIRFVFSKMRNTNKLPQMVRNMER